MHEKKFIIIFILLLLVTSNGFGESEIPKIQSESLLLTGIPGKIKLYIPDELLGHGITIFNKTMELEIIPDENVVILENIKIKNTSDNIFHVKSMNGQYDLKIKVIPGWFSLIPPIVAIMLAMITREMLISLFIGIWSGAILLYNFNR